MVQFSIRGTLMTRHPDRHTVILKPNAPKKAPDESWWTKYADPRSDWSAFSAAAQRRDLEAGWTTSGDRTRPSVMERRL